MARAPAAWTRTPLQVLSTAPTKAPRLPADRRPAYRPKITKKKRKPRRVPPPRPERVSDRQSDAQVERYKRSAAYTDALVRARLSREVQERKARLAKRPSYRPKILGVVPSPIKENPGKFLRHPLVAPSYSTKGKNARQLAEMVETLKRAQKSKNPTKVIADAEHDKATLKKQKSSVGAPIVKAADISLRPTYATAGAASAALRGKNVAEAAKKGITGKEKKTFSTVLKEQGVGGPVGSVAGFALDVAADPLTYVSFGTASAARKSAVKSAEQAAKRAEQAALKAGATKTQARVRAIEARDKELARASKAAKNTGGAKTKTGVTVRVGGKAVPGVERATGALAHGVSRGSSKAASKTPERVRRAGGHVRQITRKVGTQSNANVRALDETTRRVQTRSSQTSEKALRREARAEQQQLTRALHEKLNAMRGAVSKDEQRAIIDAIEAGDLRSLRNAPARKRGRSLRRTRGVHKDPDRLYLAAKNIEADLKYLNRLGRRSGAITGRVGPKARTLQEVRQTDVGPVRSPRRVQVALRDARNEQAQARIALRNLPADAKPSAKQAARRQVRHTQARVEFLRKRLLSYQQRASDVQTARHVQRVGRNRRMQEARGYFPRVLESEIDRGGLLERLASTGERDEIPYAQTGAANPNIAPAKRREFRKTRAELRASKETKHIPERLSEDIRPVLSQYAASVARGTSAANLNTKLIDELGRKLPRNPSKEQLRQFERGGYGIFRVRGGRMEELGIDDHYGLIVNASRASKAPGAGAGSAGGRVALIKRDQLQRVRQKDKRSTNVLAQTTDAAQRGWKGLALSTPGYFVRNLFGDTYNAYTDERAWRLIRNQARSSRVLGDLSRQERAHRRFYRQTPESKRTVKLTDQQAAEIAAALKIPADQVSRRVRADSIARLAEEMGVIRQGRFVELMEDASVKPRGSNAWKDISKRVEDQTRLATFLGGLQRGMNPRTAADRASKIHFDYGDLTDVEREAFRRFAPFYTFPARNIPHQAKSLVRRPGKFAAVAKLNEEGRRAVGLNEDYAEGLNPYEQKQLGIPIKWGDKTYTISVGLPFTDLNDIAAVGAGVVSGAAQLVGQDIGGEGFSGAGKSAIHRVLEAGGPVQKAIIELPANYSFFYRDEIEPSKEPYTRAPEWAIKMGKASPAIRKKLGLVDDYLPPDAPGKVWGWPRKMDYAFRQTQPGFIGPLMDSLGQGVKGANARNMTQTQRLLAFAGLRAIKYESDPAKLNALYNRRERIQAELDRLARRSGANPLLRGTSSNATPRGEQLALELSGIEDQINDLQVKARAPVGGLVKGERVSSEAARSPSGAARRVSPSGAARRGGTAAAIRRLSEAPAVRR